MALLAANNLTFRYSDAETPALDGLSLTVEPGEFVLLCGPSGCGKTTLLRLLKSEISPEGEMGGSILYDDRPLDHHPKEKLAREIGMVFQDPENQIVMDEVLPELVFGLENLGFSTEAMRKRVAEMVHFFGLEAWLHRKTYEISGGQKQMLNLASVLLLNPRLLLLDEPTAQLDPVAAKEFINMVHRLNREFGITVLMVEHRLEELFSFADRTVMMQDGRIAYDGKPRETVRGIWMQKDDRLHEYLPSIARLYLENNDVVNTANLPLTVREGRKWIETLSMMGRGTSEPSIPASETPLLKAKNIRFQYEKDGDKILDQLSLNVYRNELLTVVGGNGSGKSTLLKVLAGLLTPQVGKITYRGEKIKKQRPQTIAYLPQNPKLYFLRDTLEAELHEIAAKFRVEDPQGNIVRLTEHFGISRLLHRHPYDLSGGEMQKAALACVLLQKPEVLLIDEPTKGLDPVAKRHFGELLQQLHRDGLTIVMVSHDVAFAAKFATRCAMMFQGEITAVEPTGDFFKGNTFYTTVIDRMTRNSGVPEVLTLEEARKTWHVHDSSLA